MPSSLRLSDLFCDEGGYWRVSRERAQAVIESEASDPHGIEAHLTMNIAKADGRRRSWESATMRSARGDKEEVEEMGARVSVRRDELRVKGAFASAQDDMNREQRFWAELTCAIDRNASRIDQIARSLSDHDQRADRQQRELQRRIMETIVDLRAGRHPSR